MSQDSGSVLASGFAKLRTDGRRTSTSLLLEVPKGLADPQRAIGPRVQKEAMQWKVELFF